MAERIEVDPDALAGAAGLTEEVALGVRSVLTTLEQELVTYESAGPDQPWGSDKMGKKFIQGDANNGYQASRDNLLQGLEGMAGTLEEFAAGQREAVTALTTADQPAL
ncbi:hypothetical protein [Nocardia sp. NPDC057227]|uniref:hypothetical protein n=1 Tax=Nocardia sp. NPDC057227 TaxID=3346056 RepID=UPI00363F0E37